MYYDAVENEIFAKHVHNIMYLRMSTIYDIDRVHIMLYNTNNMDTHPPVCAMDLVVTRWKMSNLLLINHHSLSGGEQ